VYFFAHPPLLHFLVGGSFLLHGRLNELSYYDQASQRARAARAGDRIDPPVEPILLDGDPHQYRAIDVSGGDYRLQSARDGAVKEVPVDRVELQNIYARYKEFPHPLEARTPNIFFGAATIALLAVWASRISRRWWIGLIAAIAYATNPEVFVRTSYGGYFAIGAFASVAILLAWERWRRWPARWTGGLLFATSAFAALADHKLVFLPVTLGVSALVFHWLDSSTAPPTRRLPIAALGFALGTLLFWMWGFAIAPASFLRDHVHNHLIDRVTHVNPLGYGDYPTAAALWGEFNAHTGYLLLPVGALVLVIDLFRRRRETPGLPAPGIWLAYLTLTAIAFTVVDWRMTKHLVPLVPLLCLGLTPERGAPRWRVAVALMTWAVVSVVNVTMLGTLARDFEAFTVTPAW
jgi:hypothetical protein